MQLPAKFNLESGQGKKACLPEACISMIKSSGKIKTETVRYSNSENNLATEIFNPFANASTVFNVILT